MSQSYFMLNLAPGIQRSVNIISLNSAVITFCLLTILAHFRRRVFNRVTLRFQALIALIDIIYHITMLNLIHPSGILCKLIGFLFFYIQHLYVFVNVIIALNLQLIYIYGVLPTPFYENIYISAAFIIALTIDSVPFAFDAYGKNKENYCILRKTLEDRILFKVYLMYIPFIAGMLFCVISFFLVLSTLTIQSDKLDKTFPSKNVTIFGETINGRNFIKKLYFRIALYPISSVVCFLPMVFAGVYFDIHKTNPDWMFLLFQLCIRLNGTMNLISLLIDPHFQLAVKSIYKTGLIRDRSQSSMSLKDLGALKKEDEEYLINFPGECISFEDYIKLL